MRALFLQHDPGSGPGMAGELLEELGYHLEVVGMSGRLDDGTWHGHFPDPLDHDLIVPLGAVWSLNDRTQVGTWIDAELDLLRRADAHGVPVVGICFGGQALAAAHGGRVERAPRPELGWTRLDTDDEDLIAPGPWMQWHEDRFVLPPGALELARTEICPQAFRLRRNLGLQFHPEVDRRVIDHWLALGGEQAVAEVTRAGSDPATLRADADREQDLRREDLRRMLTRFLAEVAEQPPAGPPPPHRSGATQAARR